MLALFTNSWLHQPLRKYFMHSFLDDWILVTFFFFTHFKLNFLNYKNYKMQLVALSHLPVNTLTLHQYWSHLTGCQSNLALLSIFCYLPFIAFMVAPLYIISLVKAYTPERSLRLLYLLATTCSYGLGNHGGWSFSHMLDPLSRMTYHFKFLIFLVLIILRLKTMAYL